MQVFPAGEIIENTVSIKGLDIESSEAVRIDFSGVESVGLKAVNALLNLKKAAILNGKDFYITGANQSIKQVLDVTGFGSELSAPAPEQEA